MQKQLCGSGLSGLFRVFLFFGFGVALSGCGTPKISPSSLSRPDAEQILKIKNDYEYSYNGTFGSVGKYAVTPGEYRTEFKG